MGRKIEFFIDNDNGNVKIKDYLKRRGVSHRMLCVLKRTENGILKNELPFMLNRPSDDSNNSTLASVKPHGPQDDEE